MLNFALIGAAGYVAPRHLEAIRQVGGQLVAALDPHDSVGILDKYFPRSSFFTEFERFDRHLDKLKRKGVQIDYLVVCSPNYLHDAHIRYGLRLGVNVICEKPVVLNPWNVEALQVMEAETGKRVFTILQLRHHPQIQMLQEKIQAGTAAEIFEVELTYITSRGNWYYSSWKGDESKSGGIASNIGVHFFDVLICLFGKTIKSKVYHHTHDRAAGYLQLHKANVKWFLSINEGCIPKEQESQKIYRALKIKGNDFDFSTGFEALHQKSYQAIIEGNGFGLEDAKASIELIHDIRTAEVQPLDARAHDLTKLPLAQHPFARKHPNAPWGGD